MGYRLVINIYSYIYIYTYIYIHLYNLISSYIILHMYKPLPEWFSLTTQEAEESHGKPSFRHFEMLNVLNSSGGFNPWHTATNQEMSFAIVSEIRNMKKLARAHILGIHVVVLPVPMYMIPRASQVPNSLPATATSSSFSSQSDHGALS